MGFVAHESSMRGGKTSFSASTYFASRSSLPRFLTTLGRSLGVLYLVSITAPLRFWLRTRLLWVALASSVTSSLSTTTWVSSSRSVAYSAYPHPASSLLYAPPLLVLRTISRFNGCGVRSRRRVFEMSNNAWASAFAHHLARCGGMASVHSSTPLTLG
jgi:hypothetical protein